jgi:hypothetical protein
LASNAAGSEKRREIVAFRNWLLKEISQLNWNSEARASLPAHINTSRSHNLQ